MIENVIAQLHFVPNKDQWQETARPVMGVNVTIVHSHGEENDGRDYIISVDKQQALEMIKILQVAIREGKQYPTLKEYLHAKGVSP